jgi:hypothetical protein
MSKTLNSILEMAIVIGGLIAAPIVVLASIESVAAARADQAAITMVHDYSTPVVRTAGLTF